MEMWSLDDIGRDSWIGLGRLLGREHASTPQSGGGGSSPVKTEPPQIVLLLLMLLLLLCAVWCVLLLLLVLVLVVVVSECDFKENVYPKLRVLIGATCNASH